MNFLIADTFTDSIARLTGDEQERQGHCLEAYSCQPRLEA